MHVTLQKKFWMLAVISLTLCNQYTTCSLPRTSCKPLLYKFTSLGNIHDMLHTAITYLEEIANVLSEKDFQLLLF